MSLDAAQSACALAVATSTGNRCGHDPEAPRFFSPPADHGTRPSVLRTSIQRLQDYFARPLLIPTLNAQNRSDRQQRSERREACVALLQAILHYTDLVTLRVGIPGLIKGTFTPVPFKILADRAGLHLRRAHRAAADLRRAGLIGLSLRAKEVSPGEWRGLDAVRTVSAALFGLFGLRDELRREQKKAVRRLEQKRLEKRREQRSLESYHRDNARQVIASKSLKELLNELEDAPQQNTGRRRR